MPLKDLGSSGIKNCLNEGCKQLQSYYEKNITAGTEVNVEFYRRREDGEYIVEVEFTGGSLKKAKRKRFQVDLDESLRQNVETIMLYKGVVPPECQPSASGSED